MPAIESTVFNLETQHIQRITFWYAKVGVSHQGVMIVELGIKEDLRNYLFNTVLTKTFIVKLNSSVSTANLCFGFLKKKP